jgi:hypothetical protein
MQVLLDSDITKLANINILLITFLSSSVLFHIHLFMWMCYLQMYIILFVLSLLYKLVGKSVSMYIFVSVWQCLMLDKSSLLLISSQLLQLIPTS